MKLSNQNLKHLIGNLSSEHRLIDQSIGSLRSLLSRSTAQPFPGNDEINTWLESMEMILQHHHYKEENIIFPALKNLGLPSDRGPLFELTSEHSDIRNMLNHMKGLDRPTAHPEDLESHARNLSHLIWEHIDKEESVLFPEIPARLTGIHLERLIESFELYNKETSMLSSQVEFLQDRIKIFPSEKPDRIRGGGCIQCRHFHVTCGGMEHEWWDEEDWVHARQRLSE